MDIVKLVKKSKKENSSAFSQLIKIHEKDLYRVAIAITKNENDALDCIQETILQVYKNISDLNNEEYFKTWMIKILINKCNSLLAKNKKELGLIKEYKEDINIDQVSKIDLKRSIDNLDEDLKILVTLYYYEDINIKDISDILKIPEGTIKSRLSRARNKLKTMLEIDNKEGL